MSFLDDNYLLENDNARILYDQVKNLPIVDLHSHGDIKEIVENKNYKDIWQVEGSTDHYVWELMRRRGIEEECITGGASNKEKWLALSKIFPELIGNPTYEWIHLDLRRRFDIEKTVSTDNAEYIWDVTSKLLSKESMKPQSLLKKMNVELMCTTDNPVSGLKYHKIAQREMDWIDILPTWRPDQAMQIEDEVWHDFNEKLSEVTDRSLFNLDDFLLSLEDTHDYFAEFDCVVSDHGLLEPLSYKTDKKEVSNIYKRALNGFKLSEDEAKDFKAYMLMFFGELNKKKNWTMQLHLGALRDYRGFLYDILGPDSGGDICINNINIAENLKYFLNTFDSDLNIVIYYLAPSHLPVIASIARAFPNVQVGAPWWFNDSSYGIKKHLKLLSTYDLLFNQAGMVSDSRKLMSYDSRTEVFRRTLCSVVGEFVESGKAPINAAVKLVEKLCYHKPLMRFKKDV